MSNRIIFIDDTTMEERPGKFVKYVGPFKGKIVADTGETLVLDIDDFWSVG